MHCGGASGVDPFFAISFHIQLLWMMNVNWNYPGYTSRKKIFPLLSFIIHVNTNCDFFKSLLLPLEACLRFFVCLYVCTSICKFMYVCK